MLWLCAGLAFRSSAVLGLGIAFLGAEQAVRLATGRSSVDPWTPVYAAALLLVAELAWWSIEPRVAAWSRAWGQACSPRSSFSPRARRFGAGSGSSWSAWSPLPQRSR